MPINFCSVRVLPTIYLFGREFLGPGDLLHDRFECRLRLISFQFARGFLEFLSLRFRGFISSRIILFHLGVIVGVVFFQDGLLGL